MKAIPQIVEILQSVAKAQGGLPEKITLHVYGNDQKVESIHRRTWTEQTDFEIKTKIAELLGELLGIEIVPELNK